MPELRNGTIPDTSMDADQSQFPFKEFGLGGLEIQNMDLDVVGANYSMDGFQIRYIPHSDSREYSGWLKSGRDVSHL